MSHMRNYLYFSTQTGSVVLNVKLSAADVRIMGRWHLLFGVFVCLFLKPYCNFFSSMMRQGLRFSSACSGIKDPKKTSVKSPQWLHRHPSGSQKLYFSVAFSYASSLNLPFISSWNWNIIRRSCGHFYFYLIALRARSSFQLLKPPLMSFL